MFEKILGLLILFAGLSLFCSTIKKYRGRTLKESFLIGLGTSAYILMITSIVEVLFAFFDNSGSTTILPKNAIIFFAGSLIFRMATRYTLNLNKDEKVSMAQALGVTTAVVDKLNEEGTEKLIAYANDLIASGLYISSPSAKEKNNCNTKSGDENVTQTKRHHIKVTSNTGTVGHYDISLEEITHEA